MLLPPLDQVFSKVSTRMDGNRKLYNALEVIAIMNYQLNASLNLIDTSERKLIEIYRNDFYWFFSTKAIYQIVFMLQKPFTKDFKTITFNILNELAYKGYVVNAASTPEQLTEARDYINGLLAALIPDELPIEEPPTEQPIEQI